MSEPTQRPNDETTIKELSPELALVDADLARIARSRMPIPPCFSAPLAPEPVGGEPPARSDPPYGGKPPAQSEPPPRTLRTAIASGRSHPPTATLASGDERSTIASAPVRTHFVVGAGAVGARRNGEGVAQSPAVSEDRPARRRRRRPALAAGLLLSLAALAFAATRLTGDDGATDRLPTPADVGAPRDAPQAAERPRTNGRRVARPSSREPPPAAARAEPRRPARRQRSSPPASVFVWLPVRGASHYKVEFFRGGRKVFQATTTRTRLALPRRWTFKGRRFEVTPGVYGWSVRPGFGARSKARYGATIVASRWTVPA